MTGPTSKKYDLDLDDFIIKQALYKKNMGYRKLFSESGEKYRRISFDTFDRHVEWLMKSKLIAKDTKYAPFYLTEKCKQQLRFGTLVLVSPSLQPEAIEPSTSAQLVTKRIHAYILLFLFKSNLGYKFAKIEDLEYFLSLFGLSTNSFHGKLSSDALHKSKDEVYKLELVAESDDGKFSVNKKRYVHSPNRTRNSISYVCNVKGIKYPIARYRSDPFRKMGITQDEIKNTLLLLINENILQKPVEYLGDSIYLVVDTYYKRQIRITDLINKTENRKNIISKEKKYRKSIENEFQDPPKPDVQERTTKEWVEKEFQELRSNPKYHIIIGEIEKFAFPNWFQRIKKKLR